MTPAMQRHARRSRLLGFLRTLLHLCGVEGRSAREGGGDDPSRGPHRLDERRGHSDRRRVLEHPSQAGYCGHTARGGADGIGDTSEPHLADLPGSMPACGRGGAFGEIVRAGDDAPGIRLPAVALEHPDDGAAGVRHLVPPKEDEDRSIRSALEDFLAIERNSADLTDKLLREFGSLSDALAASQSRLAKTIGKGPAKRLRAFRALSKAVLEERVRRRPWLPLEEMAAFLNFDIGFSPVEHFYALYLDAAGRLIHAEEIAIGTTTTMLVDAREVIVRGVTRGACALVIAHNHPSGFARPSERDISLTQRIDRMAADFEMRLVDHLIVARGNVYAMLRGEFLCIDKVNLGRVSRGPASAAA